MLLCIYSLIKRVCEDILTMTKFYLITVNVGRIYTYIYIYIYIYKKNNAEVDWFVFWQISFFAYQLSALCAKLRRWLFPCLHSIGTPSAANFNTS